MTKPVVAEPWRDLPATIADVIEPELDAVTDEILVTIAREVPEYARPLEGSFGRGVRTGVTEALRQFVALIRDPDAGRGPGREVYVGLGAGELRQGRTLDSLQSAYRVGARVAWRRMAAAARREGVEPEVLSLLAESMFAYIEELSADSVEGYAEARSRIEGERRRLRRELVGLLLRDPPVDATDLRAAAAAADWRLPRRAAALACDADVIGRIARRLPPDALTTSVDGLGCAVVPDPEGPGRSGELEHAVGRVRAALGPVTEPRELATSWSLARALLAAAEERDEAQRGTARGDANPRWGAESTGDREAESAGLLRVDDSLIELLLHRGRDLVNRMGRQLLAPLDALTPRSRRRMEATALAYVRERGNAAAMARALEIHPQTARYRLARLRELLGDSLDDPDARLELELALRARAMQG